MSWGVHPRPILTHAQRVCRMYKKALRTTEDWSKCRHMFRFDACLLRARIDESNKIKDMRVLAKMLEDAEHEVWETQHYDPKIFKTDPGGIVYQREGNTPDWALDMWHPWEKVQLMDFFDNREKLKAEFGEYYEKSLKKKWAPGTPETTTNTTYQ
jgi:NADH dehydrogenase (ubiquinone) 1 beta subcomplex subunit 9